MRTLAVLAALVCAAAPAIGAGPLSLYVSPTGSDRADGRAPAPGKRGTGPFATLERARDAIRALQTAGKAPHGVTVFIRGGRYERATCFELTAQDGGSSRAPVTYQAFRTEVPRFQGGKAIDRWEPIRDAAVLDRLKPEARQHVLQADLQAAGISDFGNISRRGFVGSGGPMWPEVFQGDHVMTLARWPNDGFLRIVAAPAGQDGGKFTYAGDNPRAWRDLSDVWVHGYWTFDWADSYERVAAIDPDRREVTTAPPHGVYGYTSNHRFYFVNVLEELDSPGEWYLNRRAGTLYFWPPKPVTPGSTVISTLTEPLVRARSASFLRFRGITFECSRGSGIELLQCSDSAVEHCTVRNLGSSGIIVDGGTRDQVASCKVYGLGETGISITGGDRKTLTPGHHLAIDNDVHDYSRVCFTYRPGIGLNGVGNRVANNFLHDAPHNAILMGGNDQVVEYNEICRVCQQTGDAGAVYMGRNMTMRGIMIRYNYFHDVSPKVTGTTTFCDVMSVYLDDCFCGVTITSNLFVRAGRAAMIGGGRDNTISDNVFVDCNPAVHVDSRGEGWAKSWFNGQDPFIMNGLKEVNFDQPPYSTRYPQLATLLQDQPARAKGNAILHNLCAGGKWIEMQDGLDEHTVRMEGNLIMAEPGFVAPQRGDYRIKPSSPAWKQGFRSLPIDRMGLLRAAKPTIISR